MDIKLIHSEIFDFLNDQNNFLQDDIRYTLRKSNIGNALEEGYWFLGDKDCLVLSFWTGINVITKEPNICLSIETDGTVHLDVSVHIDEEKKYKFIIEKIVPQLELPEHTEKNGLLRYRRKLAIEERWQNNISHFINYEKEKIDHIILENHTQYFSKSDRDHEKIDFINIHEFNQNNKRIKKYISHQKEQKEYDLTMGLNHKKGSYLSSFYIENFGCIKGTFLDLYDKEFRWAFITGENGSGKTMLLKAIAIVLGQGMIPNDILSEQKELPYFQFQIQKNDKTYISHIRKGNDKNARFAKNPIVHGFAAYGTHRLSVKRLGKLGIAQSSNYYLSKNGRIDSLVSNKIVGLVDINSKLKEWGTDPKLYDLFKEREYYLVKALIEIVPDLVDVRFNKISSKITTEYFFNYYSEEGIQRLQYEQLSSGTKNILSLVTDVIVRFYDQQPKVVDPAKFKGVVIIDEIDLHLHPRGQKELIQNLNKVFPGIQFIVSTHSPIPLLGAPKETIILNCSRNRESIEGTIVRRLDDKIMFRNLLPNAILTSPIFGLEQIFNENREDVRIRTEENYDDVRFNDKLSKEIDDFLTNRKEQELINLFKNKDEAGK